MTPDEILAHARVFRLPLVREFRGITVREGLVFEGPSGWAEFAPFQDHTDQHASRWLAAALEQAYGSWPEPLRTHVPVNAIIPVADPATTMTLVDAALARGITTFKTKVGAHDFESDVARVAAIRSTLDDAGVQGAIRIDTNQQWSLSQAIDRLPVLDAIAGGLEYAEQPVLASELAELRRAAAVPIAVDEGVRLAEDPIAAAMLLQEIADVVVLKAIPLGGVQAALALADQVRLPVVVSGSLDTVVGLAAGLHLAACLEDARPAGLATGVLLQRDLVADPDLPIDGALVARRRIPDDDAFVEDPDMLANWSARLRRAWSHLPGQGQ